MQTVEGIKPPGVLLVLLTLDTLATTFGKKRPFWGCKQGEGVTITADRSFQLSGRSQQM